MKRQKVITKKVPNSTIENSPTEKKKGLYLGDYYCMKALQPKPVTEELLELIAQKLIQWVEDEENISLTNFKRELGMRDKDYAVWLERSEKLKEAHGWAKMILGARREEQACKRQLDASMIKHTLYQYAPEYKEAAEYHSKLNRSQAEGVSGGTTFVVIPKIETSEEGRVYFEAEK
jgi:hypothetical protein